MNPTKQPETIAGIERRLRSLVRERQRIWQMYLDSSGEVSIILDNGQMKTVLREEVIFPHVLIDLYQNYLTIRINELTAEIIYRRANES